MMKKAICSMVVAIATVVGAFAHDVITKNVVTKNVAYAMKKHGDDDSIYVIRVQEQGEWHDWYVIEDKELNDFNAAHNKSLRQFYGYEDNTLIIVRELRDIAIKY